jgi:hypothetical protein
VQLQSRPVQPQQHFQQMQQHQYLQQHQQQHFQLPSTLQHHAVTTCGPSALGIGLPAFGSRLLQSSCCSHSRRCQRLQQMYVSAVSDLLLLVAVQGCVASLAAAASALSRSLLLLESLSPSLEMRQGATGGQNDEWFFFIIIMLPIRPLHQRHRPRVVFLVGVVVSIDVALLDTGYACMCLTCGAVACANVCVGLAPCLLHRAACVDAYLSHLVPCILQCSTCRHLLYVL